MARPSQKRLKMIKSEYIRSLIYLNGKTITSLALEAGVDPTNLSRFLKGHSTVSDEKMEKVLEHLGVDPVTGTLKPVVHRWKISPGNQKEIEFKNLVSDLVPGGGKIINLSLNRKKDYRWSAVIGNNEVRIIIDNPMVVLEEFYTEWQSSYLIIPPSSLKRLIENEALTPSEFDEILGLKYEKQLLEGNSILAESEAESEYGGWTWDLILRRAKEAGLKPEEVAKRLGLSK